ncbi:MAG TPA: GTP cyclohydrolase II RibA [Candidatus Saccharimonadales bacterium]
MAITQRTTLPLEHGTFSIAFHRFEEKEYCLSVSYGELKKGTPIIRLHSSCLFGEALHSLDCDCAPQLTATLKMIAEYGQGTIIYEYAEGRGIGLEKKLQALAIQQHEKVDTVEAFKMMSLPPDTRSYEVAIMALNDLKVARTLRLVTQNPAKLNAIKEAGFEVAEVMNPKITVTPYNKPELLTKKNKLGYMINI